MLRFLRTTISAGTFFGNIFFLWASKNCWSSHDDWSPGEAMAGWRRPRRWRLFVVVWTWTIFGSPAKKNSPESESKNGFKDWNKSEKCIQFSVKNWAIETYFFSLNAKKVCKLKFYWASKIIKKIFLCFETFYWSQICEEKMANLVDFHLKCDWCSHGTNHVISLVGTF